MGVAEGRRIAFEEAERLRGLPWEELIALPEVQSETVIGPSGREYRMKVSFDHSESGEEDGEATYGTVSVARFGRRFPTFREAVNVWRFPEEMGISTAVGAQPLTFRGEVWKRARWLLYSPAILIGTVLAIPLLLILAVVGAIKGESNES